MSCDETRTRSSSPSAAAAAVSVSDNRESLDRTDSSLKMEDRKPTILRLVVEEARAADPIMRFFLSLLLLLSLLFRDALAVAAR